MIEYNVRMGDQETEVVLPRIASDLMIAGGDNRAAISRYNISVIGSSYCYGGSRGYPEAYEKGIQLRVWSKQKRHCFSMRGLKKRVRNCDQ